MHRPPSRGNECSNLHADLVVLQLKLVLDLGQRVVYGLDALLHRFERLADLVVQALLELVEVLEDVVLGQLVGLHAPFRFCLEDGLDLAEALLNHVQLIVLIHWRDAVLAVWGRRTIHSHLLAAAHETFLVMLAASSRCCCRRIHMALTARIILFSRHILLIYINKNN